MISRRQAVGGAIALSAVARPTQAGAQAAGDFSPVANLLDHAVTRAVAPWAVLIVTRADGELFRHAAGTEIGHVEGLRSATKLATATAILTLVQSRRLSLEDSAARFIPSFAGEKSAITVRHLLSMSAGLPSTSALFSDESPLAEACEAIARVPTVAAPGSRFIYGNLGLTVAGRIAEIVSGMSWEAFFRVHLAEPLAIDFAYEPLRIGRVGGGGRTNAESYARLLRLHLAGGALEQRRVLSPELVASMHEPSGARFSNSVPGMRAQGYGMGWWLDTLNTRGQALIVSCPGAWGAYPWLDRSRQYAAFLLIRSSLFVGASLQRRLRPLIEQALDGGSQ